ncbi:AAA family ATPase [Streptosporangium sp. 'caverna']|uniref:AAA family ATPase n=1 Tax=Streptosporangium sp. 'caverna' TaxID=2202249 RepID=UPI0013A6E262|nr:AAA family ATPase [Streptosporangium sp. 'caverna']
MASRMELTRQILFMATQFLAEHPDGLPVSELWPLIKGRMPDLDEQWSSGGASSNRPELALQWKSGGLVKSGWVTKAHGRWYLTPLGRTAIKRHLDVSSFTEGSSAGYHYWEQNKAGFESAKRLAGAVPEGSWVAAGDLASQAGLEATRLVWLFQGERPEGWHRVLDSDGGIPDDAHVDERLRKEWQGLLTSDGLDAMLGMVPQERRIPGADLHQLVIEDPVAVDGSDRPRRAWLVRGSNVHGMSLVEDWLADGYCSLPASKLRELLAGVTQEAIQAAVDEDYAHGSYNDRLKKTAEFHAFLSRMREDDLVLSNDGGKVYLGRIRGGPAFRASVGNRANLQRPVEWLNPKAPLDFADDLPDEIAAKLATQHDVLDLTEFVEELEALVGPGPVRPPVVREMVLPDVGIELAEELLVDQDWLQECVELLRDRPQMIFYGPPGTGKTYIAQHLAQFLAGGKPENVKLVQFHPAYSYEDFFEGFRPVQTADGQGVTFKPLPGPLLRLVDAARQHPEEPHVLIIDEINRGNLAKIFGELYFLLEYRDKAIDLLYSSAEGTGQAFTLPKNLIILGTMNTADRSIALVDAAMRRRFAFVELHPEETPTREVLGRWLAGKGLPVDASRLLGELNARIEDRDFKIGPSYLMRERIHQDAKGFERVWRTQILPLLEEHHYGDGVDVSQRYGLATLRQRLGLDQEPTP